jgi:ribose transport system substrate-binding protein
MRKSLLITASLPLLLAACSSGTATSTSSSAVAASSAAAPASSAAAPASSAAAPASSAAAASFAGKKVVYVQGMSGIPFYQTVACGAQELATTNGIDFSYQGADTWDVAKQTAIVDAVVAGGADAIMISVTDTKAMQAPLQKAKDAGIPIIGIDDVTEDPSIMVSFIQSNNIEGGKLAGEAMGKLLNGKGEVLVLNNEPGTPIGDARVEGFKQGLAAFPGIKFLGVQYSHNDPAKAASIVSTTYAGNNNLNGVFGVTTNNTQGAITGVKEAGATGTIKVTGYDTSDPIVQGLHDKTVDAVVVQYPFGEGIQGVQTAMDVWSGKTVESHQTSPFVIATPENVDTPDVQKFIYKMECSK